MRTKQLDLGQKAYLSQHFSIKYNRKKCIFHKKESIFAVVKAKWNQQKTKPQKNP